MDIALCTDNHYVIPCGVLLCSICENNKTNDLQFHIISADLLHANQESLKNIVTQYRKKIFFYTIKDSKLEKCPAGQKTQNTYIKLATYYRLFLSDILQNIDKVLYLDCDLLVRHSLIDLWDYDINNYAIGAISDDDTYDPQMYNRLQYDSKYGYFNSGVLLINLKYWRKNSLKDELLNYITQYPERLIYHDQDALNFVMKNKKKQLPLRYNVQNGFYQKMTSIFKNNEEIKLACKDPYILHFSGSVKPWFKECEHPLRSEFFKYLSLTEWKDMQPYHMKMNLKERIWYLQHKISMWRSYFNSKIISK